MQKDMVCLEDESTHALPYYNNVIQSCDPFTERQCLIHVYESYEHAGESLSECLHSCISFYAENPYRQSKRALNALFCIAIIAIQVTSL